MACTVVLEFTLKPEHVDGIAEAFKGLLPDTRSYDGCIDVYPAKNLDDSQNFVVVETWESREKYEKYFAWRTERGEIEMMESMMEGELSLRFFDRIGA
jgi:quinol monooxygenase YgiN